MNESIEPGLEAHVILDNLSAHKAPAVKRWLLRHPHFKLHFTRKSPFTSNNPFWPGGRLGYDLS
jgi:hypothetical protein